VAAMEETERVEGTKGTYPDLIMLEELEFKSLQYLLVLDFEATCEKNVTNYENEIIELPVVLINLQTGKIEDGTSSYL
jgi:hypothetical protein